MRILVCIKQVPEPGSSFRVNAESTGYDETGLKFVLNEYDRFAMEEAVRIREALGEVEIGAVSVGPVRVIASIRKALDLGGQQGFHIDDTASPASDAMTVASLIAAFARHRQFDLIFCGVMAEDDQRAQVGPMIAELLGRPCATAVIAEKISGDRRSVTVERELQAGYRERLMLPLPCVLTIQSGINVPRYGSLSNVLRVKKLEIPSIPAADLGLVKHCQIAERIILTPRTGACEFLAGSEEEIAERLAEIITRTGVHMKK